MGLIQSIIEKSGIPTVSISMLEEITTAVAPPRALSVDVPLGFPLGVAFDEGEQRRTILGALAMASRAVTEPWIENWARGAPNQNASSSVSTPRS